MRKPALLLAALALVMVACGGGEADPATEQTVAAEEVGSLITSTTAQVTTTLAEEVPTPTTQAVTTTVVEEVVVEESPTTTAGPSAVNPELTSEDVAALRGLGPVRLGMSLEEAVTASGLRLSQDFGRASTDNCYYVTAGADLQGVAFMVVDGDVVRIEINPPSPIATRSGVRIGTTASDLREVYPDNIQQANEAVSEGEALAFVPNDEADSNYRIYFVIEGGEVANYRLGTRPAVDNLLGCQG